jgi:uncharacterized membrane protein
MSTLEILFWICLFYSLGYLTHIAVASGMRKMAASRLPGPRSRSIEKENVMKNSLINTLTMEWIVFAITLLAGILGLVAQFLEAGNYTVPAIISLVVAVLMFVLTQITKTDQARIEAKFKVLERSAVKK